MLVKYKTYTTGIVLVHGYLRIDADLVLPKVRAQIEGECTLIAKGQVRGIGREGSKTKVGTRSCAMNRMRQEFLALFHYHSFIGASSP